ncbi:MAG: hypothetical protein J6C23_07545 [Clostridia bacterium]|nr:hypothetical protein [Clostridia bacterium]
MAHISIYKNIIFIEGFEPLAKILGKIKYKNLFAYNSQNQTIDYVKDQLVKKTIALGGNAVIHFKYGQKSVGWFKSILLGFDDDIQWYGSGLAAILPEEKQKEILSHFYDLTTC